MICLRWTQILWSCKAVKNKCEKIVKFEKQKNDFYNPEKHMTWSFSHTASKNQFRINMCCSMTERRKYVLMNCRITENVVCEMIKITSFYFITLSLYHFARIVAKYRHNPCGYPNCVFAHAGERKVARDVFDIPMCKYFKKWRS